MTAVSVRIPPAVVSRRVAGAIVAMSLETGQYVVLTDMAARIWELASDAESLDGICAALCTGQELPRDDCREQVLAFVAELVEARILAEVRDDA